MTVTVITVGLDHYDRQPGWDIPEAAESRARVEKLFVEHGAVAEDWTPSANSRDIATVLDKWTDRFTDSHIIYWVGHGEYSDDGYMAALADSTDPLSSSKRSTMITSNRRCVPGQQCGTLTSRTAGCY